MTEANHFGWWYTSDMATTSSRRSWVLVLCMALLGFDAAAMMCGCSSNSEITPAKSDAADKSIVQQPSGEKHRTTRITITVPDGEVK